MAAGRVLVVVTPHVYATALATSLAHQHGFETVVAAIGRGEPTPTAASAAFDAIVTNVVDLADAPRQAPVVVELPEPPADEYIVTAGGLRVGVPVGDGSPAEIASLIVRFAPGGSRVDEAPSGLT